MEHIVEILSVQQVTHNVRRFHVAKPVAYHFEPGQATEVSVNKDGWQHEKRPFTFTSLNEWQFLEFTTKIYPERKGVTNELGKLKPGDSLIIRDVWGTISYKGPGYFLAGGAGITPFIAILRQLKRDDRMDGNELFFANKTERDIILHDELNEILGDKAHYILTEEDSELYEKGRMDKAFLMQRIQDFTKQFYVCGPDQMVHDLTNALKELGANPEVLVFEK